MPELPDLAVLADAFDPALGGRPVLGVDVRDPLVLRATPAQLAGLDGDVIAGVRRRGKFLVLPLARSEIWAAPMLSGRFGMVSPGAAKPRAAVTFRLGPRTGRQPGSAPWVTDAPWLPDGRAPLELRYLDPTRMGKLYVIAAGADRSVPGTEPGAMGPDADDPALTLDEWRARIRRHPGELKSLLRNQAFVAGIGNAYSDEILWAARLSPFRKRSSLAPEEIDALYGATRAVLAEAAPILRERVPPTFERQVRDHLKVHLRGGQPCPRCGATISQVGGREVTSYCRACQR